LFCQNEIVMRPNEKRLFWYVVTLWITFFFQVQRMVLYNKQVCICMGKKYFFNKICFPSKSNKQNEGTRIGHGCHRFQIYSEKPLELWKKY
jgi:hypothetical protein